MSDVLTRLYCQLCGARLHWKQGAERSEVVFSPDGWIKEITLHAFCTDCTTEYIGGVDVDKTPTEWREKYGSGMERNVSHETMQHPPHRQES